MLKQAPRCVDSSSDGPQAMVVVRLGVTVIRGQGRMRIQAIKTAAALQALPLILFRADVYLSLDEREYRR